MFPSQHALVDHRYDDSNIEGLVFTTDPVTTLRDKQNKSHHSDPSVLRGANQLPCHSCQSNCNPINFQQVYSAVIDTSQQVVNQKECLGG